MSVNLFGFNINDYSEQEAISAAQDLLNDNKVSQVVTINPEMFEFAEKNSDFANIVKNAEMVIPDGIGVKIALKINGHNVARLPGIDFAYKMLQQAAYNNYPVAIIGAKNEILEKAVKNLLEQIKDLNIVYVHDGYFTDDNEIYKQLLEKSPKLILVAMGSPRQEQFIYNAKNILHPALMVGIGGSLDVWSGTIKRAPIIFQKFGLEWLYRTITQPERLKRIFPTLPLFLIKAIRYKYTK